MRHKTILIVTNDKTLQIKNLEKGNNATVLLVLITDLKPIIQGLISLKKKKKVQEP